MYTPNHVYIYTLLYRALKDREGYLKIFGEELLELEVTAIKGLVRMFAYEESLNKAASNMNNGVVDSNSGGDEKKENDSITDNENGNEPDIEGKSDETDTETKTEPDVDAGAVATTTTPPPPLLLIP